jgi:hypothetical protein
MANGFTYPDDDAASAFAGQRYVKRGAGTLVRRYASLPGADNLRCSGAAPR